MAANVISPLGFAFGGPADWVIIFIVALIVFGPKKLPEVGQQLGKALREFRKMADEITGATQSIHEEISSAAGQLRSEVESVGRQASIVPASGTQSKPLDQVDEHLLAPAPQVTEGAGANVSRGTGLKLSTNPDAQSGSSVEPRG
jgi:sec-independent protein translocase protein TatA